MTSIKLRAVLAFALALGALGVMAATQIAGASHPRPAGATPLRTSFVPAYKQCTTPNRTHGAPLAHPSCNAPVQASNFLTLGSRDANGAGANSVGFMLVKVVPHSCCPPQDVAISASISDVRCKAGAPANVCSGPNTADGPDYSGELQGNATIRITDHNSGPNFNEAATVVDIPFPVNMACAGTSSTATGGTCSVTSTAVAVVPEVAEPARAVVEFTQMLVFDGGSDGQAGTTTDNTLFEVQGIFVP
jgi:hypothetical protein